MATKRRPLHAVNTSSTRLNFRPNVSESPKWEGKGTKPVQEPSSIPKIMLMMILHACRKIVFMDTRLKVCIYLSSLFVISLLADVIPFPKTYFSRKENIFNQYFVKLAWGWTLVLSVPFVVLSSSTYCCGNKDKVLKHAIRLGVATASWFFWVKLFSYIESTVGRCNVKGEMFQSKSVCLEKGYFWQGFDVSGHAFILIYSSLVLIEEARAIIGWDSIEDMLRNEEYVRSIGTKETSSPLKNLSERDLKVLRTLYERYTPYIRTLFIMITCIVTLWDIMLVSTMLYFHSMIEKFISGCIAVSMWYLTYKCWYTLPKYLPQLPGEGSFKYRDSRTTKDGPNVPLLKRTSTTTKGQLPRFMGMPLYGLRNEIQEKSDAKSDNNGFVVLNPS